VNQLKPLDLLADTGLRKVRGVLRRGATLFALSRATAWIFLEHQKPISPRGTVFRNWLETSGKAPKEILDHFVMVRIHARQLPQNEVLMRIL
jgi:hypothetical protein